jgi:hypothetical protein
VELKTSRYEIRRVLAAWLETWRLFLGFPLGRASQPYLLCPVTNQDNINKFVYSNLNHAANITAQKCNTIYDLLIFHTFYFTRLFRDLLFTLQTPLKD